MNGEVLGLCLFLFTLTLCGCLVGVACVGSWAFVRMVNAMLRPITSREPDEPEEPEPHEPTEPVNEQAAPPAPQAGRGFSADSIPAGRCRGCGQPHFGLVPGVIEVLPNGQVHIPHGSPAVCPRCWCGMNPNLVTNLLPAVPDVIPVPEPAGLVRPAPVAASAPEADELEPAAEPEADDEHGEAAGVMCDKCGACGAGQYDELVREGTPTGKFWCHACIAGLKLNPDDGAGK